MSKTDTCTRCGREGHTASSCKRVRCQDCMNAVRLKNFFCRCKASKRVGWFPSPAFWRECGSFRSAA